MKNSDAHARKKPASFTSPWKAALTISACSYYSHIGHDKEQSNKTSKINSEAGWLCLPLFIDYLRWAHSHTALACLIFVPWLVMFCTAFFQCLSLRIWLSWVCNSCQPQIVHPQLIGRIPRFILTCLLLYNLVFKFIGYIYITSRQRFVRSRPYYEKFTQVKDYLRLEIRKWVIGIFSSHCSLNVTHCRLGRKGGPEQLPNPGDVLKPIFISAYVYEDFGSLQQLNATTINSKLSLCQWKAGFAC